MRNLLVIIISLCFIPLSLAHEPFLEEGDWGMFDDPHIVVDPAIAIGLYGYLDNEDMDIFELNFLGGEDTTFFSGIRVPVCGDHYTEFYPHYAILAPEEFATVDTELPFDMPQGFGIFHYQGPTIMEEERLSFFDPNLQNEFYMGQASFLDFPDVGTYYIIVFNPEGQMGDYALVTGHIETFIPDPNNLDPISASIANDSWLKRDCNLSPDDPNAIINLPDSDMPMSNMDMSSDMDMSDDEMMSDMDMDMSGDETMSDMDMSGMNMEIPDDLDMNLTQEGEFVTTTVRSENDPIQLNTLHRWIITLQTPEGMMIEDANIIFDGGMPQHGHGLPTTPAVTSYLGNGEYLVEGVRFQMPGWWQLNLTVEVDGNVDAFDFNFVLP